MARKIIIIDAGGTISAVRSGDGPFRGTGGIDRTLALLPEQFRNDCEIWATGFGLSEDLNLADARKIVGMIERAVLEDATTGVVVAHGTDAMEEVAFMADLLLLQTAKPVVFTGAQRTSDKPDFDGIDNLRDSIATARHPASRNCGVLLVFGGLILSARDAIKLHSHALEAFGPRASAVGRVADGGVDLQQVSASGFAVTCLEPEQAVEILLIGLGTGANAFDRLIQPPTRGIVLQGMGRGNMAQDVVRAAISALEKDVLVAVASGCNGGAGIEYGAASDLCQAGAWMAGELSARKARVLLSCALAERSVSEARQILSENDRSRITPRKC